METGINKGRMTSRTEYEMITKNNEGEAEVHQLEARRYVMDGSDDQDRTFISQAAPTIIRETKRKRPIRTSDQLTVAFGDAQIGYYNGEPFHDERAMRLGIQAVAELFPDNIVLTGDMIDLPAMSRFEQRSGWQQSTQASIDRYHKFLAELRANAPNSRIIAVHGNHELRMDKMVRNDAAELLGIRRANAEHELAVLTLQYLVRYDDLEIESVDGYPNATYWLEENLQVRHGTNTAKAGSNAAKYLREEDISTIYGHSHRVEKAEETKPNGRRVIMASPGCLARINGYVPGVHFSTNERSKVVERHENWQQGLVVAQHNPRNHHIDIGSINEDGLWLPRSKFFVDQAS